MPDPSAQPATEKELTELYDNPLERLQLLGSDGAAISAFLVRKLRRAAEGPVRSLRCHRHLADRRRLDRSPTPVTLSRAR